ncbi:hypothetical protein HNR06_002813 [Nocardiopsis arvandica]|uniref:Ribosomal protein L7/L12 C-terminal domain-containing protein n=1 Tax=Nocardiopsis sinuspersici TaxID=501010 RepID=A0A7Z0BLA4_9ACTN|nr:hypothetical protein [Nocardiopsis sinuspersici]
MMFMLFALSGALLVLGGGSYALRWILARRNGTAAADLPVPEPQVEPEPQVGGYVPAPRESDGLPPATCARVRDLVALDRGEEAVRMVRDRVGVDETRARRIVAGLGGDGRILES